MRALGAGVLLTLVVEALLALAFWAGTSWLGTWLVWPWGGVVLAAVVVLLMVALLAGDLEIDFDSDGRRLDLRIGWIARITSREREDEAGRITRTRVLFVAWTRHTAEPPAPSRGRAADGRGQRSSWLTRLGESAEPLSRALSAAAPALHELVWNSREMTLRVESPTQIGIADRALAGIIGSRRFGPLEIRFGASEGHALKARYRIRLYRAALTAMAAFVQGRPDRAMRALGPQNRSANAVDAGAVGRE